MADKRIYELTEATSIDEDYNFIVDADEGGVYSEAKRIKLATLRGEILSNVETFEITASSGVCTVDFAKIWGNDNIRFFSCKFTFFGYVNIPITGTTYIDFTFNKVCTAGHAGIINALRSYYYNTCLNNEIAILQGVTPIVARVYISSSITGSAIFYLNGTIL